MEDKIRNPRRWEARLFLRHTVVRKGSEDNTLVVFRACLALGLLFTGITRYQKQGIARFLGETSARTTVSICGCHSPANSVVLLRSHSQIFYFLLASL